MWYGYRRPRALWRRRRRRRKGEISRGNASFLEERRRQACLVTKLFTFFFFLSGLFSYLLVAFISLKHSIARKLLFPPSLPSSPCCGMKSGKRTRKHTSTAFLFLLLRLRSNPIIPPSSPPSSPTPSAPRGPLAKILLSLPRLARLPQIRKLRREKDGLGKLN